MDIRKEVEVNKPEGFEELILFMSTLLSQVENQKYPKYKRKLFNCYVNTSIKAIQNDSIPMKIRFLVMVSMLAFMVETEEKTKRDKEEEKEAERKSISLSSKQNLEEMQKEILIYLTKKEVLKIRAVVLDLCTNTYIDDIEYSVKPEAWVKKIEEELESVLPPSNNTSVKKITSIILKHLQDFLLQDLEEIFLGEAKPFGKKGNLLIVNLIYIQQYFEKRAEATSKFGAFIKKIQNNFRKKEDVENIDYLRSLQLQK